MPIERLSFLKRVRETGAENLRISEKRRKLQEFLDRNRRPILGLRVLRQVDEGILTLDREQLRELRQEITSASNQSLNPDIDGLLFQISENGVVIIFQYEGVSFKNSLCEGQRTVRGGFLNTEINEWLHECYILDNGGSRQDYDLMTEEEKGVFMDNLANRRRGSAVYFGSVPLWGFTSIIDDTKDGFIINRIAPAFNRIRQ